MEEQKEKKYFNPIWLNVFPNLATDYIFFFFHTKKKKIYHSVHMPFTYCTDVTELLILLLLLA